MKKQYTTEQIKQFWVGLIDSDGSIQCNHWKNKYLQFRIVIKMKKQNIEMFLQLKKRLGGSVRVAGDFCVWVENRQRRIWKLCEIFDKYPPLTTRVSCQLAWIKRCNEHKSVSIMVQERDKKYLYREKMSVVLYATDIKSLSYFPIWCSGFITGEGCFCIRKKGSVSFSIAQKHDLFLVRAINDYFRGSNKVRTLKQEMFIWEVYKKDVLKNIVRHCERYPLLGEKALSFESFKAKLLI